MRASVCRTSPARDLRSNAADPKGPLTNASAVEGRPAGGRPGSGMSNGPP